MNFSFLLGSCLFNLINARYLLVNVDDQKVRELNPPAPLHSTKPPLPTKSAPLPTCIHPGGKCLGKTKLSINIEFSARSFRGPAECCQGYTCVSGMCLKPRINIDGLGKMIDIDKTYVHRNLSNGLIDNISKIKSTDNAPDRLSLVLRLHSRQAFKCHDFPAVYDDQKVLDGLFGPGYKTKQRKIISCALGELVVLKPTNGNYIAYEVIPEKGDETSTNGNLNIVAMAYNKCDLASPQCRCEEMLNILFNHIQFEDGSGKRIHESVKEITIPTGMVEHDNFSMACTCFLQAAKNFEYLNVEMPKGKHGCETPMSLDGNGPREICEKYRSCYDYQIVISKKYTESK